MLIICEEGRYTQAKSIRNGLNFGCGSETREEVEIL